jgi:tRNA(His) guanylyltransferase
MKRDSLGDRMKNNYENISRTKLTRRTPVIMRLDGKAFHSHLKNAQKPYDHGFIDRMHRAAETLFDFIGGNLKLAYVQSDEISLLLTDWDNLETGAFFDYNIQKLVSTVAAKASVEYNHRCAQARTNPLAVFDARAFNIPREEVANYFIWRQKDWIRNSMQMLGQAHFSPKELHGKKLEEVVRMVFQKTDNESHLGRPPRNWHDFAPVLKYGTTIRRGALGVHYIDYNTPVFTEDRAYIEDLL